MQSIAQSDLVSFPALPPDGMYRIDLQYASPDNLLFGEVIYDRPGLPSTVWLHQTLAKVIARAAATLKEAGYRLIIYDGLRTVTSQERMLNTAKVHQHPQWIQEPRLLSPPGKGGHPRGMAVDISIEKRVENVKGEDKYEAVDMGTPFDFLAENSQPANNPAHRDYPCTPTVRENRNLLDRHMKEAAIACGVDLLPLPQEWWDYRLPPAQYESYRPLSDADVPPEARQCKP